MAKIQINKKDLVFQMEQQSKLGELPDTLVLEGITFVEKIDPFYKAFPSIRNLLTYREVTIFRELWLHKNSFVSVNSLLSAIDTTSIRSLSGRGARNTIAVHVGHIRRKISKELPNFNIETRKIGKGEGKDGYRLYDIGETSIHSLGKVTKKVNLKCHICGKMLKPIQMQKHLNRHREWKKGIRSRPQRIIRKIIGDS